MLLSFRVPRVRDWGLETSVLTQMECGGKCDLYHSLPGLHPIGERDGAPFSDQDASYRTDLAWTRQRLRPGGECRCPHLCSPFLLALSACEVCRLQAGKRALNPACPGLHSLHRSPRMLLMLLSDSPGHVGGHCNFAAWRRVVPEFS